MRTAHPGRRRGRERGAGRQRLGLRRLRPPGRRGPGRLELHPRLRLGGPGDVLVQLRPPSGPPQEVARARSTAACGRFGQHLLAGTRWRSPAGRWYLLAAGSREVTAITASGAVRAETGGRSLVAPVGAAGAPVSLTARLASGARITALDGGTGGRD